MFGGMKNIANLMKNMGEMNEKAAQLQKELESRTVVGESGAGAVRVTLTGKGRVVRVELDQNLLLGIASDDKAMVEELIAAAFNAGMEKVQRIVAEEISKLTGGLNLPGLSGLLGN